MRHFPAPALCTVFLILGVMGCGSSDVSDTPKPGATVNLHPRIIANEHGSSPDAFYRPNPIRVTVGQTVTWVNQDKELHDVTAESGAFTSGPIAFHSVFRWKALRPG